jgi:hypothetical protein
MKIGQRVRSKRTGRRGIVQGVIDPPRNGRSLYVMWVPGPDVSLLSADELDLEAATPEPPSADPP